MINEVKELWRMIQDERDKLSREWKARNKDRLQLEHSRGCDDALEDLQRKLKKRFPEVFQKRENR